MASCALFKGTPTFQEAVQHILVLMMALAIWKQEAERNSNILVQEAEDGNIETEDRNIEVLSSCMASCALC